MKLNQSIFRRAGLIATIAVGILQCWLAHAAEPSETPLNIVLLYSGDMFLPAAVIQDRALRETISAGTKRSVNFYVESLHGFSLSEIGFDGEIVSLWRRKYQRQKIDLIIAAGTAALNFLERHRPELWPEAPAMFFSVEEGSYLHRKFSPGLTGLGIKFDPAGTLDFAVRLQPDARRVVVVSGASEFDRAWLPGIQTHLQNRYPTLSATYLTNQTVAELTTELGKLPADSMVFFTVFVTDASGRRYVSPDVAARLSTASSAPLYGLYETLLDRGIIGGVMPGLEAHGRRAGELALRIIAGEKPDAIPMLPAVPAVPMVDWRQLQRWGISEKRLPPGAVVLFRPPSTWEEHKVAILFGSAVILAQMLTIIGLLVQRVRRRRSEEQLRESETRIDLAADAANLGLWIWNLGGDEIWATVKWRELFGFTPTEHVSFADFTARVHPDDRADMENAVRQALEKKSPYEAEYRACLPGGGTRWIGARGVAGGNGAGQATRMLGVCIDLTERKRADTEIQRQRAELAHVSRVSIMGELSASMAHELNQPLTAILANAQAAQRFMASGKADLDEFREILKDIAYDTTRARDVIRHLRALVKRSEPNFTRVDVGETIREVVGFLHGDVVARNVRVGLELTPDLPPVQGDHIQLQQILINLLLNAFDALSSNPVAERLVTVATVLESPRFIRVTVRDGGVGIPPENLDSIFEPFFTTKREGMGMGLSVTRSIVEAHGGRIWAETNPDRGAAFHFTLPVIEPG